jgi:hypothetical protein
MEHVCNGDTPSVCGRIERGPPLRPVGQAHVRPLHGAPRVTTFEEKAEADQGDCDGDRLRGRTGVLGCVSIHHNLMDEERITVRRRVKPEFVAQTLALGRGVHVRVVRLVIQTGQP